MAHVPSCECVQLLKELFKILIRVSQKNHVAIKKILKIGTSKMITIIVGKVEQFDCTGQ